MRFLSLFSGIEAASQAWLPLGWECVGFAEIEAHPSNILAVRHPGVPNLGDVTKITEEQILMLGQIDAIVFGSPCQDLSVAGKRKGLDGARSGLFFTAMRIVGWAREWCDLRFALWENVPGAFTSNKGADFAAVVDALAGLEPGSTLVPPKGWGTEGCAVGSQAMVEWSTLDAQWFGVAQRRRRVFALADFGDWASRPPILLESQGVRGDLAPSRKAGQAVAGTLAARTGGGGFPGTDEALDGYVVADDRGLRRSADIAACLDASYGRLQGCSGQDANHGHSMLVAYGGNNTSGSIDVATALNVCGTASGRLDFESETFVLDPLPFDTTQITSLRNGSNPKHGDPCHPLAAGAHPPAIAFDSRQDCVSSTEVFGALGSPSPQAQAVCVTGDITHALNTANNGKGSSEDGTGRGVPTIATHMSVRRLTPRECERLQDFPDDHTLIVVRGKPLADGPRYKALGNSMCVSVMRWIGQQMDFVWRFC